jgi:hypothetical protein
MELNKQRNKSVVLEVPKQNTFLFGNSPQNSRHSSFIFDKVNITKTQDIERIVPKINIQKVTEDIATSKTLK